MDADDESGGEETGRWQIGDGYQERTRPLRSVPTAVEIMRPDPTQIRPDRGRQGVRMQRRRPTRDPIGAATRWLTLAILVLTVVIMTLGALLVRRELTEPLDTARLEDRLDQLDGTVIQWAGEDLPAPQKTALETRITHLSQSLCHDLTRYRSKLPAHLRQALEDVCRD